MPLRRTEKNIILDQMQTIKVSEICLNMWEIDHIGDNKQQLKKKKEEKHMRDEKFFILLWAKSEKKKKRSLFLFSLEGIKSPKRSDQESIKAKPASNTRRIT